MDIHWMYDDATHLESVGRLKGAICLLLCYIDAIAARTNPGLSNNRQRYCDYLKSRLVASGHDQSLRVEKLDRCVHLSEIIYTYFRCSFLHEGDSRDNLDYEVQLDYEGLQRSVGGNILMDRQREQIIVKAEWLVSILKEAVENEA